MAESEGVARLRRLIEEGRRIAGFTGAGISTESGIPDYRSAGGIWDRYKPVYFQEFLTDPARRRLYWQRRVELWPAIARAEPGSGHRLFARLRQEGRLLGVITQNIDGLHERSGLDPEYIVNLHGTALEIVCLECGRITPTAELYQSFNAAVDPRCCVCGGLLKPNTISFGQALDPESLRRAEELVRECDLMIAMGSTLSVHPAAGFPREAVRNGAALAIVTLSPTPLDGIAEVVINARIDDVVRELGY